MSEALISDLRDGLRNNAPLRPPLVSLWVGRVHPAHKLISLTGIMMIYFFNFWKQSDVAVYPFPAVEILNLLRSYDLRDGGWNDWI